MGKVRYRVAMPFALGHTALMQKIDPVGRGGESWGLPPRAHPGPRATYLPIASQEAQAGRADLITEDDHGQQVAVGLAVLQLNDPPLKEASGPRAHKLPPQLDAHTEVVGLFIWVQAGKPSGPQATTLS